MTRRIAELFAIERQAVEAELASKDVHTLRQKKSRPVLAVIEQELAALRGASSASGSLAKAVTYLANQWPTLVHFLDDGRVPIHNNACENAIRRIAVGRKNWLFAGSLRGGQAAATIYSLIESCRRVDVDPFLYLHDVLVRVCTHSASRVHELVPAAWKERFAAVAAR
jgi:hypothetical protein